MTSDTGRLRSAALRAEPQEASQAKPAAAIASRLRALVIMDEVSSDNPLGRDAATLIEELVSALDKCRAIIKFHVRDSGVCCTLGGSDKPFSALDAFNEAVAVLAKAREEDAS